MRLEEKIDWYKSTVFILSMTLSVVTSFVYYMHMQSIEGAESES